MEQRAVHEYELPKPARYWASGIPPVYPTTKDIAEVKYEFNMLIIKFIIRSSLLPKCNYRVTIG